MPRWGSPRASRLTSARHRGRQTPGPPHPPRPQPILPPASSSCLAGKNGSRYPQNPGPHHKPIRPFPLTASCPAPPAEGRNQPRGKRKNSQSAPPTKPPRAPPPGAHWNAPANCPHTSPTRAIKFPRQEAGKPRSPDPAAGRQAEAQKTPSPLPSWGTRHPPVPRAGSGGSECALSPPHARIPAPTVAHNHNHPPQLPRKTARKSRPHQCGPAASSPFTGAHKGPSSAYSKPPGGAESWEMKWPSPPPHSSAPPESFPSNSTQRGRPQSSHLPPPPPRSGGTTTRRPHLA